MPPSRNQNGLRLAVVRRQRDSNVTGLAGAVLLHVGVVAAALFSWPHSLDIAQESPPVVPVELVTIGDKTNIKAMVKEIPKEPAEEQPAPQPTPQPQKIEAAPPPQQKAEVKPEPKAEPAPSKDKAPEKAKPEKKPVEEKKEKFDINNIMALLDKKVPKSASPRNAVKGDRTIKGIGAQDAMTMQLADALRNQIAQCWSPPVGAPHPEQLLVVYQLYLNQDGSVAQPPQLALDSSSSDPYWRAAAEAARRAIYMCAPYKLPADRYQQWKDITLDFDPRKMLGQ
jgi:hypothetical protein